MTCTDHRASHVPGAHCPGVAGSSQQQQQQQQQLQGHGTSGPGSESGSAVLCRPIRLRLSGLAVVSEALSTNGSIFRPGAPPQAHRHRHSKGILPPRGGGGASLVRMHSREARGQRNNSIFGFQELATGALLCLLAWVSHSPPFSNQQGADQPTPRRTELRNGTFPGFFSAVRLGLRLPSIIRRRRSCSAGRSPAARRAAAQGGAQGGERPRPSDFCAVAGRERASGPIYQEGQMGQKMVRFGQLAARGSEISSRRVDRGR
jgi:hypothetical protein